MGELEQIEIARYKCEIVEDVRHMMRKYCRIMGWEVPELDESAARALIIKTARDALSLVESENQQR